MRRFWGVKAKEIERLSIDEIEAFYDTLPPESATVSASEKTVLGVEILMLAQIIDSIKALQATTAGKRIRKNQLISNDFIKKDKSASQKTQEFEERIRRKRAYKKLLS